jgi:hypothetical protein
MSALTVTLGADITALKRGMAAAAQLVAASARRMTVSVTPRLENIARFIQAIAGQLWSI